MSNFKTTVSRFNYCFLLLWCIVGITRVTIIYGWSVHLCLGPLRRGRKGKKSVGFPGRIRFKEVWLESTTQTGVHTAIELWHNLQLTESFPERCSCDIHDIFFNVSPLYDILRIMNQIWLITLNKLPVETNPKKQNLKILISTSLCNTMQCRWRNWS